MNFKQTMFNNFYTNIVVFTQLCSSLNSLYMTLFLVWLDDIFNGQTRYYSIHTKTKAYKKKAEVCNDESYFLFRIF